jgi:hypothetical protein
LFEFITFARNGTEALLVGFFLLLYSKQLCFQVSKFLLLLSAQQSQIGFLLGMFVLFVFKTKSEV